MTFGFGPANSQMAFLQQEFQLPTDPNEMRNAIGDRENRTASALNIREIGQYETVELLNAQTWFAKETQNTGQSQRARYGYRRVFDLVALNGGPIGAGNTTISVSPLISTIVIPTRSFGSATINGPKYLFFPSMNIDVTFDNSNPASQKIEITNNVGSNLTQCYVTIEYLKQG